jgi:hypothetical protein
MCCGDLSGFDSERSHSLDVSGLAEEIREKFNLTNESAALDPVQPPTEPAYKNALNLKRADLLAKPSADIPKKQGE